MRAGIATDHDGFILKEELLVQLHVAGHEVVGFGAHKLNPLDDYPDSLVPLERAVGAGKVPRDIAICGGGVSASVCTIKLSGVRVGLVHTANATHGVSPRWPRSENSPQKRLMKENRSYHRPELEELDSFVNGRSLD